MSAKPAPIYLYSPGPWESACDDRKKAHRLALVITSNGHRSIDCTDSGTNYEQDCANARLVAASPKLLEALLGLMLKIDGQRSVNSDDRVAARSAIAAALGLQVSMIGGVAIDKLVELLRR